MGLVFRGDDREIGAATPEPEFETWKWLAIEALPRLIVPFKRDTYAKVIAAFRNLAFTAP
jgi:putative (di)nucleoside polyphosphate hydrolase